MKQKLIDRFCRYVKIDTQSDPESFTFPSSEKQFNLANILAEELKSLGLSDVTVDKFCYVMATVASNSSKESQFITEDRSASRDMTIRHRGTILLRYVHSIVIICLAK